MSAIDRVDANQGWSLIGVPLYISLFIAPFPGPSRLSCSCMHAENDCKLCVRFSARCRIKRILMLALRMGRVVRHVLDFCTVHIR